MRSSRAIRGAGFATSAKRVRSSAASAASVSRFALRKLPREVAFANQVAMKRTFSWTRFLGDLEEAVPPRVAINSIRVDSTDTMITLNGSAASLQALTVFIIGLEDHRAFAHALLQQHRMQDNGLVEFGLTVRYHREEKGG